MKRDGFFCTLLSRNKGYVLHDGKDITFGRSCSLTYPLVNKNVSKEQVLLKQNESKEWLIQDLKSLNGTFVNGKKITPMASVTLQEKDIIYFSGPFLFQFTTNFDDFDNWAQQSTKDDAFWVEYIKEIRAKSENLGDNGNGNTTDKHLITPSHSVEHTSPNKKIKIETMSCQTQSTNSSRESLHLSKSASHLPNTHNYHKIINQLRGELIAKKTIVKLLTQEQALKKDQFDAEKKRYEARMELEHECKLKKLEEQVNSLLTSQNSLAQELISVQNVKSDLVSQLAKTNEILNQTTKELNQKQSEVEKHHALKTKLEEELSKNNREKAELQRKLDSSFANENKLSEERQTVTTKIMHALENDFQCVICHETLVKATVLKCSHLFCQLCVETWLKTKRQCPVCRKSFGNKNGGATSPFKCSVLGLDNFIDAMNDVMLDKEARDKRKELKLNRAKAQAASTKTNSRTNVREDQPTTSSAWYNDYLADYLGSLSDVHMDMGGHVRIFDFNSRRGNNNNSNRSTRNGNRRTRGDASNIIEVAFGMDIPPSSSTNQPIATTTSRNSRSSMRRPRNPFLGVASIPESASASNSNSTTVTGTSGSSTSVSATSLATGPCTITNSINRVVNNADNEDGITVLDVFREGDSEVIALDRRNNGFLNGQNSSSGTSNIIRPRNSRGSNRTSSNVRNDNGVIIQSVSSFDDANEDEFDVTDTSTESGDNYNMYEYNGGDDFIDDFSGMFFGDHHDIQDVSTFDDYSDNDDSISITISNSGDEDSYTRGPRLRALRGDQGHQGTGSLAARHRPHDSRATGSSTRTNLAASRSGAANTVPATRTGGNNRRRGNARANNISTTRGYTARSANTTRGVATTTSTRHRNETSTRRGRR